MNCGTYTICLTKKQAKLCSFPPKTPVYVLDDDGHISSRCKVDKVLMTLNPPQLVYQVKSRFSTEYTSEDKLRFQVGCKVDVQHRLSKQSIQSLRGIVVGTCKISCKKSNNDHGNLNVSTVGYSIEVERHKSSCDHSPIGTILHVHPRDVSLCINKATNLDEDSLSTGKKLNASLRKNTEFKKQNKCKKKSKVLNIHITSNRKRTFCELVVGCPSGDVKPKEGSKTVKKRRSDYSKEGNIENSSEDDASMCSMLTEIDTRKEVPGFISDDHQSTRDFGDFPVGRPLGLYEISI